jgi:hypothetical protein
MRADLMKNIFKIMSKKWCALILVLLAIFALGIDKLQVLLEVFREILLKNLHVVCYGLVIIAICYYLYIYLCYKAEETQFESTNNSKAEETPFESIDNFNLDLLKEAMRQVELLIQNEDNKKLRIDARAYQLLNTFGVFCGAILTAIQSKYFTETTLLYLPALSSYISILFLLLTLRPVCYGHLGTLPGEWIKKEIIQSGRNIEENNKILGRRIAEVLQRSIPTIQQSRLANEFRGKLLVAALCFGLISASWLVMVPLIS